MCCEPIHEECLRNVCEPIHEELFDEGVDAFRIKPILDFVIAEIKKRFADLAGVPAAQDRFKDILPSLSCR